MSTRTPRGPVWPTHRVKDARRSRPAEKAAAVVHAALVASLRADPRLSDLDHGRRVGISARTVARVRGDLAARP